MRKRSQDAMVKILQGGKAKRLKTSHDNNQDHISHLPDGIIADILSRLLIQSAVRTCVLSKAWVSKWTLVTKVILDDELFNGDGRARRFLNFMEGILPKVQILLSLEIYSGRQDEYDPVRMTSCIDTAFSKGTVQTAIISCLNDDEGILIPSRVFNSTTLQVLNLSNVKIEVPSLNVLSSLKKLELMDVVFQNEGSTTKTVRFHLPVLEECDLTRCSWDNIDVMEIYAPKMLKFCSVTHKIEPYVDHCTIRIIEAKIEYFSVFGGYPANFHLHGTTVESARVDCNILEYNDDAADDDDYDEDDDDDHNDDDDDDDDHDADVKDENGDALTWCGLQLRKLLREFSGLIDLTVSGDTVEAIAYSSEEVIQVYQDFPDDDVFDYIPGPRYVQLEKLYVHQYLHKDGLLELLHWTPYLKFLNVKFDAKSDHWIETYGRLEMPSCIVSCLEAVELDHFTGTDNQYDLIKYVLQSGAMLQSLVIRTKYHSVPEEEMEAVQMKEKEKMEEQLQSFSRASNRVQIMLDRTVVV